MTVAELLDDLKTRHALSVREVARQSHIPESALRKYRDGVDAPMNVTTRLARLHRRYRQMPTSGLHKVG